MDQTSLKFFCDKYPFRVLKGPDGTPNGHIVTSPVRLAFAKLDKPAGNKFNDKLQYSCVLIVPTIADVGPLQTEMMRVATAHFGDKLAHIAPHMKRALKKDSHKTVEGKSFAGKPGFSDGSGWHISATANPDFRPKVVDQNQQPLDPTNSGAVYSGMWCLALLRVWCYPKQGAQIQNPGIGLSLVQLQKVADDERFQSVDTSDAFGTIVGGSMPSAAIAAGTMNAVGSTGLAWDN